MQSHFHFFFWPHHAAWEVLITQPGIEPVHPALESKFLTTRQPRTSQSIFSNWILFLSSRGKLILQYLEADIFRF